MHLPRFFFAGTQFTPTERCSTKVSLAHHPKIVEYFGVRAFAGPETGIAYPGIRHDKGSREVAQQKSIRIRREMTVSSPPVNDRGDVNWLSTAVHRI